MSDITVPAFSDSHGRRKSGNAAPRTKGRNGPISYIVVNEEVWRAIQDVARLRIAGREFRTIEIKGPGNVSISNWRHPG